MEEKTKEKIVNSIKLIMKYVDPESDVIMEEIGPDFYGFNVRTKESSLLIGRDGANIGSLDHLVKMLVGKDNLAGTGFVIDINGYRKIKIERLKQIAKSAALRVSWRNQPETLSPMSAFERRIVHTELSASPLVETKSIGQDPNRAIVVSPLKPGDNRKNINIDDIINS